MHPAVNSNKSEESDFLKLALIGSHQLLYKCFMLKNCPEKAISNILHALKHLTSTFLENAFKIKQPEWILRCYDFLCLNVNKNLKDTAKTSKVMNTAYLILKKRLKILKEAEVPLLKCILSSLKGQQ